NKDNSLLATGGADGNVTLWDVSVLPPKNKATLKISSSVIFALALTPNAKLLAVGSADTRLALWDLAADPPRETATGDTHKGAVQGVAFTLDGKTLITASADKTARLWTLLKDNKLKEKAVLEGHTGAVTCVAVHPTDDKLAATGSSDGTV